MQFLPVGRVNETVTEVRATDFAYIDGAHIDIFISKLIKQCKCVSYQTCIVTDVNINIQQIRFLRMLQPNLLLKVEHRFLAIGSSGHKK